MAAQKPILLDNNPAAEYLGLSPGTLPVWRSTKRYDLPWVKVGRKVKYDERDLIAFLESRKVGGRRRGTK